MVNYDIDRERLNVRFEKELGKGFDRAEHSKCSIFLKFFVYETVTQYTSRFLARWFSLL